MKRENAHDVDAVAHGSPHEEVSGELILGWVGSFDAADILDEKPQRRVHERAIQTAAANTDRQCNFGDFANDTGRYGRCGAQDALGKGKRVLDTAVPSDGLESVFECPLPHDAGF